MGLVPLVGGFLADLFQGQRTWLHPLLGWLETLTYRLSGVDATKPMTWQRYLQVLLLFNLLGCLLLFLIALCQPLLPFNPQNFPSVSPWMALTLAVSFVTNTGWQSWAAESTLSSGTQMIGVTVQHFLSGSTGICCFVVLSRGIFASGESKIGNFWVDLTRSVVYLFLPLATALALLLVGQGVVQSLRPYETLSTQEEEKQTIALGPAASEVAVKQLGTGGGGFFKAQAAHPFENPTGVSNVLEIGAMLLLPASLLYTFGLMARSLQQGRGLFVLMALCWIGATAVAWYAESGWNPVLGAAPLLEGKETRFGIPGSILWTMTTTTTSTGTVNAVPSSLMPLSGGVALFNMMLGGWFFGGVGVGGCRMLFFVLLAAFLASSMIGKAPEYMRKRLGPQDISWVLLALFFPMLLTLLGTGISCVLPAVVASIGHEGPHGLTQMLYSFTSTVENNGSAFAELKGMPSYFSALLMFMMLAGRLTILVVSVVLAGSLAQKKSVERSSTTFSTQSPLFLSLVLGLSLLVGAMTFLPALSLGPVLEQALMQAGRAF